MKRMRELVYIAISPHRGSSKRGSQRLSLWVDWFITTLIIVSSALAFASTFELSEGCRNALECMENVILWIFAAEYLLRLWTADLLYKFDQKRYEEKGRRFRYLRSVWKYMWSPLAIVDLVAVSPLWLPVSFLGHKNILMTFRLFRLIRLTQYVERYEKVLDNMLDVLKEQRKELKVSLITIGTLMMVASVLMYVTEHEVQPEHFRNAFSGLWWAVTTITTLGYGDIVPVTVLGRCCGAIIALAGVAFLAVPTALISSGFMKRSITPDDLQRTSAELQNKLSQIDEQQDQLLSEQGKRIDALMLGFADFERQQREIDQRQNKVLEQHKQRIDQFASTVENRLAGLETAIAEFGSVVHGKSELSKEDLSQLSEVVDQLAALVRRIEVQQQAMAEAGQSGPQCPTAVAKPESAVKRALKNFAAHLPFRSVSE